MVCSILEHTTEHGAIAGKTQTSKVKYYNLDTVISVGYRVNSAQVTHYAITGYQILEGYGSVSRKQAEQKAFAEYDKFNKQQPIESDFDREVKKLLQKRTQSNDRL